MSGEETVDTLKAKLAIVNRALEIAVDKHLATVGEALYLAEVERQRAGRLIG
ncbi:MAG TPA: hypothetical protein VGF88_23555 [Acidobacteriaceae bacterium]